MSETVIKQSSEFSVQKTTLAIAILPFRCESHAMECLHGKTASYNLLEGIYANAVAHEVQRFCVESCNGCQIDHLSQRQHDCLAMNENQRWQMDGLQAIERVIKLCFIPVRIKNWHISNRDECCTTSVARTEYTTLLNKVGREKNDLQFNSETELNQNSSSFIDSESKFKTESQLDLGSIFRCKAFVISLQMLPKTIKFETIKPVNEASCLAFTFLETSVAFIDTNILLIFFCGMDKVFIFKSQSRPNHVKL